MMFHFNERQRFSLRKYSFGLASVLLGTAFFLSGQVASADEVNVSETLLTSVVSVSPESSTSTSESSVPRTSESKPTVADKSDLSLETANSKSTVEDKAVVTPEKAEISSDSEKVATDSLKSEKSEASANDSSEDTAKVTEAKTDVTEKDDKSIDKAPAEASRSTRTRRATSENKREVSNWSEFVSALEDGNVSEITVNGDVVAQGDNGNTDNGRSGSVDRRTTIHAQSRPVTIQGKDGNARLDLLSHTLELTGASWELNLKNLKIATANSKGPIDLSSTSGSNTVTFENVTSVGSSLYGGGNTHVVIKGTTTSTVSDSYQAANGQTQHVQRNVGAAGHSDQRRESNIHSAKSVTVAEGASLILSRSSQGDAITLESGAKVSVKDKGSLTINMNTDNRSENARYHNAGIFMADSGTVETGKDSKLVLNTSIGQGISIGVNRPADGITDKDRYGGYVAGNHGRKNGPSRVLIGDGGTFEFHGRDGIMMGNHSELVTGQNAKVRFENKGRGVALDFGNDSRVVFGKHSNNTFHSVGKGKNGGAPSGSYDGYNYIGLNENGKILVDDFATFRVQMDNRGDNDWDDVISLGSQNGTKSEPLFQANKGSIVDIRDDNTNYYAELTSVALGASKNTYFQFNNPLYVSFMRYTNSQGLSAGEITGKLPVSIPQGNNPQDIGHGNILYISDKTQASRNRIEFNGPASQNGGSTVGTYTVYSMNKDGRDSQTKDKQSSVWTNIQNGSMPIAGFQSGRPDIQPANAASVPTGSSSGGVSATDRTYGIDPVGHNRQNIWVSNGSKINPTGVHKNIIKYVYEDGTPVKNDVIQSSEWNRTLDVSIDKEGFENILRNSSVRNGDEFLAAYSKAKYHISDIDGDHIADTGWKEAETNSGTYNYGTIASPKLEGYKAEIKSSNVPGLVAGAKADSVSVSYDSSNAPETLIDAQAGKRTVSETYWRNIVAKSDLGTYETVVVYKKVKQKAIIKYVDTSANNKELAKDEVSGKSYEAINYSTAAKIADFANKGYKLVEDGFTNSTEDQKKFDSDENIDQEFVVRLEHDVTPVGPNNPHKPTEPINPNDPNSPRYPAEDQWKKDVTSTVHYVVSDGKATAPADNVQNAQWTRTLKLDKVTGKVLNPTELWTANKANYDAVPTPGLTGYYADKGSVASKRVTQENLEETVTYKPLGNLVPKPETPNDPNFPSTPEVKYPNDPNDPTKPGKPVVPNVPGYKPYLPDPNYPTKPGEPGRPVEPGKPITPENPGTDTEIIYRKADQKAVIKYVDQNTGATLESDQVGGKSGEAIVYSTADKIKKYQDRGYVLVSDGFPAGATYDKDESVDQEFVVTLKHGETPVGPNDPHNPTDPINPNDPNSPKYPAKDQWKKDVTSTVHYVVSDGKATAPEDKVEKATWTRTLTLDKVTGAVLSATPWSSDKTAYAAVPTPGLTGYYADKARVEAKTVTEENLEETVTYTPLGNLVPKPEKPNDPNFPSTPEVKYPNDPNDPTKPGQPVVPNVPGYKPYLPDPNDPTKPGQPVEPGKPITPEKPGEDTPIIYRKADQKAIIKYVDTSDNNKELAKDEVSGKSYEAINYSTAAKIADFVNKGYKLVEDGFTNSTEDQKKFDSDENIDQEFVVRLEHDVTPVGPNNPHKPTDPINPNDPKSPKYPAEDQWKKDVTSTVHYVVSDGKATAPEDKVEKATWTRTLTLDKVTGAVLSATPWASDKTAYAAVPTPGLTGYYADKGSVASKTVTEENLEETVTYNPLGKLVPKPEKPNDPNFPSTPEVKYPNDPNDPTKPGKPVVPDVPGYKPYLPDPNDPTKPGQPVEPGKPITPEKPGTDTQIIYRKVDQKATIKYVDQTTGQTLANDQVGGKSGEAINYSTADKIKYYEDRGYVLVSDEFPAGAHFDTDASVDQTWTVTLKHGETPVGPNDPHNPTDPINPNDPNSPKYPATDQWKKDVTSTVKYVVSDGKVAAPADHVENATWTRTLTLDKVTGKELSATPWASDKTAYAAVPTPSLTGYYADKASVASKAVTQENLEETVTYKPLGNLVPKPETPNDPNFPSTPKVKYPNDPTDPTKPGQPVVPDVPGYEPHLPDPNDPTKPGQPIQPGTPVTPDKPGEDTPIIYVPKTNDVTQPTKQTVTFEGAGSTTPKDDVQSDYTFTGKKNQADGTTTWTENSHDYGKVKVPVVEHYYADKAEAGGKTVTPENPEETDTVTYKPLGNLVPKPGTPDDPNFPSTPKVKYPNDPTDPGKPGKPVVPDVPGYKPYLPDPKDPSKPGKPVEPGKELPNLPTNPGEDTPIIYVPIVNDVKKPTKQTVKFEGAGDKTPGDNVQDDFTFTGKENKASGSTTWTEKSHTYGKVSVPVIPGYYADKTEAGGKTVTPENPEATDTVTYKPLGNLVPKPEKPNDPNFPSTPEVKYPNDPTDPGKPGKPVVPDVPGYKPYLPDPKDPSKPGQPVEPGKELPNLPTNPGDDTPIIYVPIVNDVKKPTKQTVKFEGAGDKTPGDNVQDDFTFTGKENKASGTTTWNEKSHTYGKVSVPVIPGYYADKTEAGGKTVTPENPEATDTVTYKPLGKLVPKPEKPNDPNFPSTPEVKYPNDPTDPGKPGKPVVPNVPGYKPYLPDPKDPSKPGKPVEPGKPITPENPGDDTPIIYVPIVNDVKKPTKQTVKFEGAGDKTPGDNVQDDFTFTGKENKASGTTTWNEKSHTYGKVSVPVIPGYYADKTEAGGKTVTPENPEATDTVTYKPLGSLVPKSDDPKFPSTPDVKYPNDPKDPSKPGQPVVPDVPGYKPYLPDPKDPSKPGKPVEPGKPITPENPGDDTPIIYVPIINDVKKPTKQTVKFEGAGDKTPGDNVQDDFTFTGKENKASGTTTWNEKSHTYGKVSVPVIPGYYADKTEAGGKTVTPENPEATDTVTYKPLGSLVPKSDDPKFPSTPDVKYPNDPKDPSKPGKPVVPDVPGYKPYLPDPKDPSKPGKPVEPGKPITPENPGDDTPIIYVPIVNDVKKPTKQTVKFEGAGDKTPGDNVQDDFTFTGKENKASGTATWTEKSHTYGKVSVPVIPGYYADKTEAGGKTVTPENPEATDTVTYKPLGKLVPKPEKPNDPNFPSTPEVKYPNDPTDPGKPGKPVVPDVPGYKPYLPDPKDPSKPGQPVEPGKELPNLPTNPGDDTPIIYVPVKPDTPVVPNPEPQTPAKPDPKPLDPEKVVQELPNTGTDSNTVMTGLGIIGMATTLLGLARKKKED